MGPSGGLCPLPVTKLARGFFPAARPSLICPLGTLSVRSIRSLAGDSFHFTRVRLVSSRLINTRRARRIDIRRRRRL